MTECRPLRGYPALLLRARDWHSVAVLDEAGWPLRVEIERRWQALMSGEISREDVHDWTVPWVEGLAGNGPSPDLMVGGALQTLHGFTMAHLPETPSLIHHGPPGVYVKSETDIRTEFGHWRERCGEYDQDPTGYRDRALARGRAAMEAEMQRRNQR